MAKTSDGVHFEISADVNNAVKELGNVEKSLNDTQKAAAELQKTIKNSGNIDIISPDTGQQITGQIGQAIENSLNQLKTTAESKAGEVASGAASAFNNNFLKIADGLNTAGQMIENSFGSILKRITAGVTAINGIIGLTVQRALSIGGSFKAQMTSVQIISGATAEELEQLTKKAREMGASLPITAQDAAMAMQLLAQRGTSARDILASVSDVANLAISQGTSMAHAAELLGSTMTNFGISVERAGELTDMFNNASNQSALDMSKLSEALKYVAPTASAAGLSLEETIAAMEVLANAGLEGSMIGTGLSGVIQKLSKSSEVLGVKTQKLDGTLRPIKEIFTELQARGLRLSEATKAFGVVAAKSAVNLTKYGSSLGQNEVNLKRWGATQAAVQDKAATWPNTWSAFQSAVEELHIEIFDQIEDQSKSAVSNVTNLTRIFSEWINKTQIASKSFNAFLSGLGVNFDSGNSFQALLNKFDVQSFVDKIKNFASSVRSIADAILGLFNSIKTPLTFLLEHLDTFGKIAFWGWIIGKGLQVPMAIINIANAFIQLKTALAALSLINLAPLMAFLTTPIGWAVAGVAAVGAGAYYINSKYQEARQAEQEKELLEQEIKSLNNKAEVEVNLKLRTGFEAIPEAYQKASKEIQSILDENVAAMQNVFKKKIIQAINDVNASTTELSERFKGTAQDIDDVLAGQITRALQGNKQDFERLSDYWKQVTERLVEMGVVAGQATGNIKELINAYKTAQSFSPTSTPSEYDIYTEDIASAIDAIVKDFPEQVKRFSEFLDKQDMILAVDLQFNAAEAQLKDFIKNAAEKYKLPKDIIEAGLLDRLKELSAQNNKTAQSIMNNWQGANNKISNFINLAKDAVEYLGASPAQFTPALNKLTAGIQKIDPLTGKVTEAFKKAYNALKEWGKTNLDNLTQRIQKIKKAMEGGFLNKKALEAEYKNVSEQLKIQIKTELEPTKGQYSNEKDFYGVAASEYMSRLSEMGGDTFVAKAREEFSKAGIKSGEAIGKAIMDEVTKAQLVATRGNDGVITIKTQEVREQVQNQLSSQLSQYEAKIVNVITNGIKPLISETKNKQAGYNSVNINKNITDAVTPATTAIQSLISELETAKSSLAANTEAVNKSHEAINSVIEALKLNQTTSGNITAQNATQGSSSITQALTQDFINKLTPLVTKIEASNTQYIQATQEASNTVSAVNPTIQSLTPVIQELATAISSTNGLTSDNTAAIINIQGSINEIINALKSLSASNTFNIEINQSGFTVGSRSDVNNIANSTVTAIRNGIGNGM